MAGSDRAFEDEFGRLRGVGAGAVAPETEAVLPHHGGHFAGIEQAGGCGRVGQIEVNVVFQAGDADQGNIRQRLVPSGLFIDLRAQAQSPRDIVAAALGGVGPDDHQFAMREIAAIGDRFGFGCGRRGAIGALRASIDKAAQLLGQADHFFDDWLAVEPRRADDLRLDAQRGRCGQQRLKAGVGIAIGRADDIGVGASLVGAFFDADDDDDRGRLVADRGQRRAKRAAIAGLAGHRVDIARNQDRRVKREGGVQIGLRLRIAGGGGGSDKADDCHGYCAERPRAGGGFG